LHLLHTSYEPAGGLLDEVALLLHAALPETGRRRTLRLWA
jgi:hypothetical protein